MRVLVYTSVQGGYDPPHVHEPQSTIHEVTWAQHPDVAKVDPRLAARLHKCLPPHALYGFDVSIWIDGSIEVVSRTFVDDLVATLGDRDLALFEHASRTSIAQECDVLAGMAKYAGIDHRAVAAFYHAVWGFNPFDGPLYELGVIVRRNSPFTERFGEVLWHETQRWSIPGGSTVMDQILVPPVLHLLELTPAIIPGSIWTGGAGGWWRLHNHPDDR